MKLIINMGLSAQTIDIPLSGETIEELVAQGEIAGVDQIWDILRGEAGDAPVPPTVVTLPTASAGSIAEGNEIIFTAGVYAGDEPVSVARVLRVDGAVVDGDFSELVYTPPVTGTNRVVTMTETASNAAGTHTETVTVAIQRIPVAPAVNTHVSLAPAMPAQGETITITPPTWTGDTPLTITFEATLNGSDVSGAVSVAGDLYAYTAPAPGEFEITFSAQNAAGGPVMSGASVTVSAFVLNNTGLNPATADIMVEGESQACSWLFDTWDTGAGARPSHEWSQVFRSAYSGAHFSAPAGGAGALPGGMPGIGNGAVVGPLNGTEQNWLYNSFPAGNDPRNDLASFDALVIWERSGGGFDGTFADPFGWHQSDHMIGASSDFRGEWFFAERAAQNGIKSIYLAAPRQPMISDGNNPANGIRAEWRALQDLTDRRIRARQQYLQHKLVAAGHSDVSVYVIPFHLMEMQIHDDIDTDAAGKPATIDSIYNLHAADSAGGYNNNGYHVYMRSVLGAYFDWCLAYAVLFATSPVGLPASSTNFSVTADEAAYAQQLAWDIAQDYYPTGLGGSSQTEAVWEAYANETLPALLPATSCEVVVPTAQMFTDLAGTIAAVNGDPIGNINGFAAANSTDRPILNNGRLDMSDDPMSKSVTPFRPNYGLMVVELNDAMGDAERILQIGTLELSVDNDDQYLGSGVSMLAGGAFTWCGVPGAFFDGRPLLIEWECRPGGQNTAVKVIDLDLPIGASKFSRQVHTGGGEAASSGSYVFGGPERNGETTEIGFHTLLTASDIPSDIDRLKIYARLESILGAPIWFPEAYG